MYFASNLIIYVVGGASGHRCLGSMPIACLLMNKFRDTVHFSDVRELHTRAELSTIPKGYEHCVSVFIDRTRLKMGAEK